jgi:manganese-dependent ADP-ribose/CDP-alcohol diphosphatase
MNLLSKHPDMKNNQGLQPFTFGIMADIQYAGRSKNSDFQTSIGRLEECVFAFNKNSPAFIIHLGDLIDGYENDLPASVNDLEKVLLLFSKLEMPAFHVLGNHCLFAGRENLRERLGLEKFYYDFSFEDARGWRFIVIDGNDGGYGIVSNNQLQWFNLKLKEASQKGEMVIVFCHYALLKEAAKDHRMNVPDPLLDILDRTGCTVAWLAGHDHAGGYAFRNGVHHLTFKGIAEAPENNAYAMVKLQKNALVIVGSGDEPDRNLALSPEKKNRVS